MNTDFKIFREETFSFKGGKMYLMLLCEDGNFGVEVVNREKTFGRKNTKNRAEADFLFETISDKLLKYKVLAEAENAIVRCFEMNSINKLLFVLIAEDSITTQADIVVIHGKFEFITRPKFGYVKKKKELNGLTIYLYENRSDKKPYGLLYGSTNANDFKFEFL